MNYKNCEINIKVNLGKFFIIFISLGYLIIKKSKKKSFSEILICITQKNISESEIDCEKFKTIINYKFICTPLLQILISIHKNI